MLAWRWAGQLGMALSPQCRLTGLALLYRDVGRFADAWRVMPKEVRHSGPDRSHTGRLVVLQLSEPVPRPEAADTPLLVGIQGCEQPRSSVVAAIAVMLVISAEPRQMVTRHGSSAFDSLRRA